MMWFFAVLIVLAMGGVALLAAGKGAPLAEEFGDRPDSLVPADEPIRGEDLRRVRFSLAFRGYRMSEVDALLDRMARELEAREPTTTDESSRGASASEEGASGPVTKRRRFPRLRRAGSEEARREPPADADDAAATTDSAASPTEPPDRNPGPATPARTTARQHATAPADGDAGSR